MADADGFLGRWARRKNAVLKGEVLPEPAAPVLPAACAVAVPKAALPPGSAQALTAPAAAGAEPAPEASPLTLQDAQALTPDSDFKPFMGRAVQPEVRNAAMKQLFSDPHFNVMDGLDIYIDDYSKPDPLPLSMLKQMASAKFLKLVEEDEEPPPAAAPATEAADAADADADADAAEAAPTERVSADDPAAQSVAQSAPVLDEPGRAAAVAAHLTPEHVPSPLSTPSAPQEDHAHPDLRLQPDHAARRPDAGGGAA